MQNPSTPQLLNASTVWMFPGQGSQIPGMLADFEGHPHTKALLQEANETLGRNLSALMAPGADATELQDTRNAQPALLAMGYIAASYLQSQSGQSLPQLAAMAAGHSVGEYTAAAVTGVFSFSTALKLVQTRADAMAAAVPQGQGGMSAVLGLTADQVAHALQGIVGVHLANDNAPGQIIISGELNALEQAETVCKAATARRVVRLNVAGPFHTPTMQPAAQAVQAFLAQSLAQNPAIPLVMNATAQPTADAATVATNLVAQITQPVRWRESLLAAANSGLTTCLELGPGTVLSAMAPRIDARLSAQSLGSRASIDAWLEQLV